MNDFYVETAVTAVFISFICCIIIVLPLTAAADELRHIPDEHKDADIIAPPNRVQFITMYSRTVQILTFVNLFYMIVLYIIYS